MKRSLLPIGLVILLLAVSLSSAFAQDQLTITVSPKAIFLDSHGTWLTVHTNFALSGLVDPSSVILKVVDRGIVTPSSIFADNQGNLVAKFDLVTVKGQLIDPYSNSVEFILDIDGSSAGDIVSVLKRDLICSGCRIYVN